MNIIDAAAQKMIEYMAGDPKRIQHFTKVYAYAALIGRMERLDSQTQTTLELAALVHDIGIREGEKIYGSSSGPVQEKVGPAEAEKLLASLGVDDKRIARISYLVGHHHHYQNIEGIDYQILVEADFLVNLYEDDAPEKSVRSAYKIIFKTESGKQILKNMYCLKD